MEYAGKGKLHALNGGGKGEKDRKKMDVGERE